uniref:Uncharacterized protein n=1 Tax=Rhipicephalus microplus TaxID=6941 RepID=A0A6G5AGB3_RHIMP
MEFRRIKNNQNHYITPDINGASYVCETGLKVLHQMLHSQPHCCPSHSVYICCLNILKLHLLKQHSSIGVMQKEPNESALSYKVVTETTLRSSYVVSGPFVSLPYCSTLNSVAIASHKGHTYIKTKLK